MTTTNDAAFAAIEAAMTDCAEEARPRPVATIRNQLSDDVNEADVTRDEIISTAHRMAWRYQKSTDPNHSDTYTFNERTLLEFANALLAKQKEQEGT